MRSVPRWIVVTMVVWVVGAVVLSWLTLEVVDLRHDQEVEACAVRAERNEQAKDAIFVGLVEAGEVLIAIFDAEGEPAADEYRSMLLERIPATLDAAYPSIVCPP